MAKAKKLLLTLLSLIFSIVMAISVVACDLSALMGGINNNGNNNGNQNGNVDDDNDDNDDNDNNDNNDNNNDDNDDDNNDDDNVDASQVTEAQFNAAIDISGVSFQAEVNTSYAEVGEGAGGMTASITYAIDKIKVDQNANGERIIMFYEKVGDNYFAYVEQMGTYFKVTAPKESFDSVLMYTPAGMLEEQGGGNYSDFTYNESIKAYVYSMTEDGASGSFKLYFENAKIVKMEISMSEAGEGSGSLTVNYSYSNVTVTLPEVSDLGGNGGNEDVGGGDDNQEEHVCDMQATAWFDKNKKYPKTLECSCGEKVTRADIEISTADEFVMLAEDLANGVDVGRERIKIVADIDLAGKLCPSLVINNMRKETKIYSDDGVTISGLDKALIAEVKTGLVIENITLDSVAIYNSDGVAGAFINTINIGSSAMKKDVTIKNCKVTNSTINASTSTGDNNCFAGGIYGKVADGTALGVLRVDRCTVENSTITSSVYAGAVAGAMSNVASGKNPTVAIAESIVQNNTVISAKERGAGIVIGLSGFGACNIDQDTSDVALTSNNAATGNEIENLALYGVTGWASANDKGTLTMMAAMQLQYSDMTAVHQLP